MLELNMNGKRLSDNDIVVLISKDSVQDLTEVKFFTDDGEVALDDITATIDKVKHSLRCAYQLVESLD